MHYLNNVPDEDSDKVLYELLFHYLTTSGVVEAKNYGGLEYFYC